MKRAARMASRRVRRRGGARARAAADARRTSRPSHGGARTASRRVCRGGGARARAAADDRRTSRPSHATGRSCQRVLDILSQAARLSLAELAGSDDEAAVRRRAAELRTTLTRLGPSFIKAGQLLANRPDFLPAEYAEELGKLQDDCERFSASESHAVLLEELGPERLSHFEDRFWEREPIAAASLGQVYKAKLKAAAGGHCVAVKVQRPMAREQIQLDVRVLRETIGRVPYFAEIVNLIGTTLLEEVDYLKEAANCKEFASIQRSTAFVVVPRVFDDFTTRRVLVLEFINGQSPKALARDKKKLLHLTRMAVQCTIGQLLFSNILHGDPHAGNLFYTADSKLAYLDFGSLCRVKPRQARALLSASVHIMNKDYGEFISDLVEMEVLDPKQNLNDVVEAFDREYQANSGKSDQLRLNTTMMSLGYEYKFKAPPYYTTLVRALAPLEGYGLTADPSFNILETSLPFIVRQICLDTTGTQEMRALSETLRKESLLRPNFKQQGVLFYVRIVFYVFLSFLSRLWRRLMAAIGSKWGSVGEHVGEE